MLAERAAHGVQVRLCFGDPNGHAAALRGREEGIGDTLAARIRASLTYYRSLGHSNLPAIDREQCRRRPGHAEGQVGQCPTWP
ncbi:hypothetical protein GCM10010195_51850 [Kitasatospora griseola]|nr:hypothetical protein GCM10010195_51850 [Kitasatospora griseola]